VSFSRLTIQTNDFSRIRAELQRLIGTPEQHGIPVIVDSSVALDLSELLTELRQMGVQVLGIVSGVLTEQAQALHLPILMADQPMQRIQASEPILPAHPLQARTSHATNTQPEPIVVLHHETLRTGQQLIAEHGDVILTADMNSGSELIAMGSVHVYGTIRGRVLAGSSGQTHARIFCQRLEAELVSVAGTYHVADDIPAEYIGQAVQICLNPSGELEYRPLRGLS
ncbi:MAG: septum site-determining protein MinC, partial [Pseudomonadota bacterium]|nr:septum site-determining protein MinC [Pseudomonadota bacterium]